MHILMVGDIVGSPGRRVFRAVVQRMRAAQQVHAVIANGENAAAGNGITPELAAELLDAGADILTLGDHAWNQKTVVGWIDREPRVLRPANFAPGCPGRGWAVVATALGRFVVINLIGRVFMPPSDCPFRCVDGLLAGPVPRGMPVLVDFHAEATSEKIAMGWHLDGRVTAMVGSHTHVQTSDERLLPGGTAYCTDLGMTGPEHSVLGRDCEPVLRRFRTGMPARFDVAKGPAVLEGVRITLDAKSGRAERIERVRVREGESV